MVISLERGADLHISQLMPLPLTVSCFSKITRVVLEKGPLNGCACVYVVTCCLALCDIYGDAYNEVTLISSSINCEEFLNDMEHCAVSACSC